MNNDNTQGGAEPSLASAGSHGPPDAWLIHCGDEWQMVSLFREHADAAAAENDAEVVPLYRHPTLTDEEREAMHRLCRAVTHYVAGGAVDGGRFARDDERAVAAVRGWLDKQN
jgi:hypothetical protein